MNFNEKYKKEELEKLIFVEGKSYREIGKIYGVSDTYIKKVCGRLGIKLRKRKNFPENFIPHNKGMGKKVICKNCGKETKSSYDKQIYCSFDCSVNDKRKIKYQDYLNNQGKYCNVTSGMRWLKKYFLEDQNNKCDICGIDNIWNGKSLVFVMDHIDGDASNNKRNNLRLICHNCDSQLDTYKSKNKNSARKERYLLNYKNKE